MTTPDDDVFRLLALCAQRPGHPHSVEQLPCALAGARPDIDLVEASERDGLAPLLLAHIREAKASVAPSVSVRLFARCKQHARAAVVRRQVVGMVVEALTDAGIPLLVLKGAALAQLVYGDAAHRPMRDVDLLVRRQDAKRAYEILTRTGFSLSETRTAPTHHHLPGVYKSVDGTTVVIELHHQLLPPTPLLDPIVYDDLLSAVQRFEWNGLTLQTLGREDMVWHVYAHAFVVNPLCPGIRLGSLADLIHAIEAWGDLLDWEMLRRRHGPMLSALRMVHQLVPWSAHVADVLNVEAPRAVSGMRRVSSSPHWSMRAGRDVLWLPEWWFRMRYGIDTPWQWMWYRSAGHPLRVGLAAAGTAARRLSRRMGVTYHPLLDG